MLSTSGLLYADPDIVYINIYIERERERIVFCAFAYVFIFQVFPPFYGNLHINRTPPHYYRTHVNYLAWLHIDFCLSVGYRLSGKSVLVTFL
jgi:hypothetical protein